MKKKTLTRGIALAMLLVFTMTAFIVPTSAKVQSYREVIQPDANGFYPSVYNIKKAYGSTAKVGIVADVVDGSAEGVGNRLDITFDIFGVTYTNEYSDLVLDFDDINLSDEFGNPYDFSRDNFTISYEQYNVVDVVVEYEAEAQSGLINTMFGGFGNTIKGITNGIKTMFNNILYVDGTASSGLSAFAKFGFVMSGLTMALGLGYVIINKIR